MSFMAQFNALPLDALVRRSMAAGADAVRESLGRTRVSLEDFAHLIGPAGEELLEPLCRRSQMLTRQRFGRVIRLFAPLYLGEICSVSRMEKDRFQVGALSRWPWWD